MIRVDQIKCQFGGQLLFASLSWTIPQGARLGLVGPNGAGKTTLLRILDGSRLPDAGSVHRVPSMRVGYLPQEVETMTRGSVLSVVLSGFAEVARLEQELLSVEAELTRCAADDARTARLTERYGQLRDRYEQLDGDRLEARAKSILSGLGVPVRCFLQPIETLSGGWRMRVALARLLLGAPGLLLLDEPTNHLDLQAIDWLEQFLDDYEGAFVVVSHDRFFLNRMVRSIVELDRGRLTDYPGNYEAYVTGKAAREAALQQVAKQQAREIKKVERFIERFRYKNTKARQVQSRIKALDKMERVATARATKRVTFDFPQAARAGDVIARAEGLAKRYGETTVYERLDLVLERGARVALVSPNGSGKSTLLKLLAGRIEPDGGRLQMGHNVMTAYYAQHQLDELTPEASVLEELERAAAGRDRLWARNLLGCFLFVGDEIEKRVAVLSGGEKARLALARLLARPSNLLLLDEPTNHLDLRSREVLEEALNEYGGSMVVISHDRYFINRVATSVGEVVDGRIEVVPGDYDEFVEWKRRRALDRDAAEPVPVGDSAERSRRQRREDRRLEAAARNRRYRERRAVQERLAPLEREIAELERTVGELTARQAQPAVYRDPQQAAAVGREKSAAEARLKQLVAEWEALVEAQPPD